MKKYKINKVDIFRITGMAIILLSMGLFQFHKNKNGIFTPIEIPKEMWTLITGMFTFTAMSIIYQAGVQIQQHSIFIFVTGGAFIGLLSFIVLSIFFDINIGKEWWSAIGIFYASLYGAGNTEGVK
jgi:hypothetical protein